MKYKIFEIEFFIFSQWETGTSTLILLKQERTLTVRLNLIIDLFDFVFDFPSAQGITELWYNESGGINNDLITPSLHGKHTEWWRLEVIINPIARINLSLHQQPGLNMIKI